jgi:RNA polymerase sigma-70 factor (ECF subfamily)
MTDVSAPTLERAGYEAILRAVMRALDGGVEAEGPARGVPASSLVARPSSLANEERREMSDAEDVRLAGRGDGDAYRRLVERHQGHVARLLWRFDRDRRVHEELVQDVFVEAYLSMGQYRGKAPFEHWLTRIATRVGYRYWKEKARRRRTATFDLQEWEQATGGDGTVPTLEPEEAAQLLHRVFERLAPRDRLVLTLRYLEQCDVIETAERTGWSKTMVKVQTMRARNRLRKLLEQSGMEWAE